MKSYLRTTPYNNFFNNIQSIITIAYIFAVGIGMLFTYKKFNEFGINIFEYADIFDFLIAPFSDYKILIFTFSSLILSYLMLKIDLWLGNKFPRIYSVISLRQNKKTWFENFRFLTIIIIFFVYIDASATIYGKDAAKKIKTQNSISLTFTDNEQVSGILIGKTKEILFFMNNELVKAVPINHSIKHYQIN